jgi:hypothetical protein
VSLEGLEASRKKTLLASGVLFLLAGAFLLSSPGGREWAFPLGVLLALFAQSLIKNFRVKAKEALVAPLAEPWVSATRPSGASPGKKPWPRGFFPLLTATKPKTWWKAR